MRTCSHCNHQFDDKTVSPAECPACGRQFTVSDVGSATLEFTSPDVSQSAATLDNIVLPGSPAAGSASSESTPDPKPKTVGDATGMTIQSGRWEPSAAELADAAASDEGSGILKTLDSSFLGASLPSASTGPSVPNVRDVTQMWDSSHYFGEGGSSFLSSPGSQGSGASGQAPAGSSGGSAASSGSSPSSRSISSSSPSASLEQSLVIQSRILRQDTPSAVDQARERIDYNLLKKLGEGGMGIVYAARQQSIRRVVALKMLKNLGEQQASHREKFLAEAVITGDLEHPNIVPIYDLGRDESGAIFYAMKHVKGTPWDALIKKKSVHENLDILMKVADAVAFAHSRDVIHRDLKPENVMLGDFGEVLVMDWGLAISISAPLAAVAMGGTPAYMAPEMAMGPVENIGVGSDVYLLGAILFEIVTGQRPHVGSTVTRCLMAAAKNEIVKTEKTGELVAIALKAMASQPPDRYLSVQAFQDAIREYQSHTESIVLGARAQEDLDEALKSDQYDTYARALFAFQEAASLWDGNARAKAGVAEAALAYAKSAQRKEDYDLGLSLLDESDPRHQELIGELRRAQHERDSRQRRLRTMRKVGVGLVAAIFLIVTGAFFWIRSEAAHARAAEVIAKNERAEALRQKGVAEEQRTQAIAARTEESRQRKLADERRIQADAARQEEERQRQLADAARKQAEYEAYIARIGLVAAKMEENAFDLTLLNECPAHLRHWEWGRLRYLGTRDEKQFDYGQPIEAVAVSPDGKRVAAGGWGGEVRVFEIDSGKQVAAIPTGGTYVFALAFSPDGENLAAGTNSKPHFVSIWDASTGQLVRGLDGHKDAVLSVVYSKDGSKLLTGSYDNSARLWDVAAGTSQPFIGHDWWVWSAAFSPDEKSIVTASQDGSALVWSAATRQPGPPFLGHTGPVYSAVFSPDGQHVASGSYDKRVLLWRPDDLRTQDLEKVLAGGSSAPEATPFTQLAAHTSSVRSVRFSSDGRLLLSGGSDNALCVWDVASHDLVKKIRGHESGVSSVAFAPGDDRVVSGGYDHDVRLWSISKYEEVRVLGGRVLKGHRDSILGAAFSPDGQTVVTASRDRSAIAWNVASGQQLRTYDEGHAYLASAALFFPDGKHVLTSAVDNTTRIWDVAAGTQVATLQGTGTSAAVALSNNAQWIVTGSDDNDIQIWDSNGKSLRRYGEFSSEVTAVAVSPDDWHIFIGDAAGRCRLLDAATGKSVWEARSHSRRITAAAFVPGKNRVLTASLDNSVGQWDLATGREDVARALKHGEAVTSLAVSSDGKWALTACADKVVRLWDIEQGTELKTLPIGEAATTDVAFSPDGRRGLTTSEDNRVRLWDLASGTEIHAPGAKAGAFLDLNATPLLVWSAAFSADGDRLLTVGGAEAHLWEANDAKQLMVFSQQSAVSSVQFSKSGEQLVTGSWDNAARVWNTATGAALVKLSSVHTRFVNASVFSPDGTKVLTASDDKTTQMWDAATGKPLGKFVGHEGRVTDVAFSSDGKWVLTASDDKTARIWDAATGKSLHVLQGHAQAVLCAEFSADDQRVITGSEDTTARLWDAATGEPLPVTLAGHTASVTSVAFTPDGLRALTGSKDITTKVWDPATGKEILTLTGHTQEITTVSVSPDGRSVLTGSRDGTAIVWPTVPWREDPPVALLQPAVGGAN